MQIKNRFVKKAVMPMFIKSHIIAVCRISFLYVKDC